MPWDHPWQPLLVTAVLCAVVYFLAVWLVLLVALALAELGRRYLRGIEVLHERYHRVLEKIDEQPGSDFVSLVVDLLKRDGCVEAEALKPDGKHGLDVLALAPDGRQIAVACYRYTGESAVTQTQVSDFHRHIVQRYRQIPTTVMIATSGRLTENARAYAENRKVVAVERPAVARWVLGQPPIPSLKPRALSRAESRDRPLLPTGGGARIAWLAPPVALVTLIDRGIMFAVLVLAVGLTAAAAASALDADLNPDPPPPLWPWLPLWGEAAARLTLAATAAWVLLFQVT
ncbi:restriction endonuclease [Frankia sp. Cr1]|uniref:restriction endonuclease n=1 Tax=Frankia sp. Cr1 TaxID=3073931 RepID=UPI002AD5A2BD|nr:restriction endonuclease [Frankia sp. Cr1]